MIATIFIRISFLDVKIPFKLDYALFDTVIQRIGRATIDFINMVKRVNLLLMLKKKQGSECTRINVIIKINFWKFFFNFTNLQMRLMSLLSFSFCNCFYICVCVCILLC